MRRYISYEKSEGLYQVEPDLTAGRQAGRQSGIRDLGEVRNFKRLLQIEIVDFPLYLAKVLHCLSKFNTFLTTISLEGHFIKYETL